MDFKVRAVDFLSIYVKQNVSKRDPTVQIKLIRGLLKGLTAASTDKHTVLFERIKAVLSLMGKLGQQTQQEKAGNEETKDAAGAVDEAGVLMTEMSRLLLKP